MKETDSNKNSRTKHALIKTLRIAGLILFNFTITLFMFFGIVGKSLTDWFKETFHTRFREIVYTYNLGLKGADMSFMKEAVYDCRYELAAFIAVILILLLLEATIIISRKTRVKEYESQAGNGFIYRASAPIAMLGIFIVSIGLCVPTYRYADQVLEIGDFLKLRLLNTHIYDDYYVDPKTVDITESDKKHNLILIYVESMETTYASRELGGYQDDNLIPNLTRLAKENVCFSDREESKLGGTHNPYGTTWTTASILASSSGIPFAFKFGMNMGGYQDSFAAHLTTLGDILDEKGFNQMFLCGSDAEFGGRKALLEQHGKYQIEDYYTAVDRGYIDEDYYVWWGYEDHILYDIAKDRLKDLSEKEEPFNFTMLTVDTHHVGGYKCSYCPDTYESDTANVIACADKQIKDFIDWCKEQDFYKDTTIVILGDHPRMDKKLVDGVDDFEREAYNCFINSVSEPVQEGKRVAVTMDLFPTILSSMGYKIEGDRLGLGTDLFSDKKTLAEELTYEKLNNEVGKGSKYYQKNFN